MTDNPTQTTQLIPVLQDWWSQHARALPWRKTGISAWEILVSEVMSQQTPMTRVAPYWTQWITQWPTPADCANAPVASILLAWGNLGYPSRALRLQTCAKVLSTTYDNTVPNTYEELIQLPGIGRYTASAVLSFALHQRITVVDTNIRRVLSRAFLGQESIGGTVTSTDYQLAEKLLPYDTQQQHMPASVLWNQCIMEIGATTCTSKNTLCSECPLSSVCKWKKQGFPGKGIHATRKTQKWKGTNRQLRGLILKALREQASHGIEHPHLTVQDLQSLWDNADQIHVCCTALEQEKLVSRNSVGDITFPDD